MLALADVEAAGARLAGVIIRTPVLRSDALDERAGCEVFVKAEALQRGGAFKLRGAYNAIAQLDPEIRARGVFAYSSGNHAQGVAIAARLHDVPAVILMPEDAPALKVDRTRAAGAEVVTYDRYTEDREELGRTIADERGLTLVPPFDHPHVMAGQGTVALELFSQVGALDVLVVPIGGGGLIAGCATVAKAKAVSARIVGVEPADRRAARDAIEAGEPVVVPVPRTLADGQQTQRVGHAPLAVMQQRVDAVVGVSDEQLVHAMRALAEDVHLVSEPSGAAALAAVLAGAVDPPARRVGVVCSGGNIDAARLAQLLGDGV